MAINIKKNDFPKWKPKFYSVNRFSSSEFRIRYKSLRNSSDSFLKKNEVRDFIFQKYDYKCARCNSNDNIQIDHIISIYQYAKDKLNYESLNSIENLTCLCSTCNSSKLL